MFPLILTVLSRDYNNGCVKDFWYQGEHPKCVTTVCFCSLRRIGMYSDGRCVPIGSPAASGQSRQGTWPLAFGRTSRGGFILFLAPSQRLRLHMILLGLFVPALAIHLLKMFTSNLCLSHLCSRDFQSLCSPTLGVGLLDLASSSSHICRGFLR